MKSGFFFIAFTLLFSLLTPSAQADRIWARTILHPDGTRTESWRNSNKRLLEQHTYDKRNTLVMRRLFQLNAAGKAQSGVVFDGKANPLFFIEYNFDQLSRLSMEKIFNRSRKLVRKLSYAYDANGKRTQKAVSFADGKNLPAWFKKMMMHPEQLEKLGKEVGSGASKKSSSKSKRSSSTRR
ncbi:MAG: hypothetical protein AAF514_03580 [Verrucomicrobiota bacterium]